jgi:ATP-dependent RNA helicase DDX31/DBP7
MADDSMLLNFDLGDVPLATKISFKGGRWQDRQYAKKSAARYRQKQTGEEPTPPARREIFNERSYDTRREEYIGPEAEPRAPKRQRVNPNLEPTSHRSAATVSIISGKLPPGSINIDGPRKVKRFDDDFKPASGHSAATVSTISGKLPPGSISVGRPRDGPGGKPVQIISSLFSFNPASKTKFEEPAEVAEPAKPSNAPLSDEFSTFTTLGMSRRLAAHLATKLEMKAPTAIQKAAIPQLITDDSDAFIQAETGSGKTLAYLLPIVERIMAISANSDGTINKDEQVHRNSGLFAIVLAPTRELCKQISLVLDKLLRCAPWIVGTTVLGGESKQSEKARLRKGVNILIATPGRLADHLDNTEVLDVSRVRWLILDEGDRLMELGFEEEIRSIVDKIGRRALAGNTNKRALPARRVTILCSATMKMDVQKLGEISLKDAVHIKADLSDEDAEKQADGTDSKETGFSAPAQLQQAYAVVPAKLRLVTLTAVLKRAFARRGSVMKAIVFISCADSVDFHFSLFSRPLTDPPEESDKAPTPVTPRTELIKDTTAPATAFSSTTNAVTLHKLHGSLAQNIRTATLKAFTDSKEPCVLICTDVASRGLDLPNVDYVIEYDPPFSAEDHLHRIGRTARAGRSGRSLIFLLPGPEEEYVSILSTSSPSLTAHTADELLRKGFGGTGHEWEERATDWQLDVERWALESPKYLEMARRGFQSHIRAYATHVAKERGIFNMQELHLGHLAKAFALRDRPGSIKVPGLRPSKMTKADRDVAMRKAKREKEGKGTVEDKAPEGEHVRKARKEMLDAPKAEDQADAAKRMKRKMMEHMAGAAEFNIG